MKPTIEHIALWTVDIERLRAFYEEYFGASATNKYTNPKKQFQSYFLRFASGTRLELMQRPDISAAGQPEHETLGYAHLAFALGSDNAVDALTKRLEADGYHRLNGPRWTGDGYYESVILDPDGNRIELTI